METLRLLPTWQRPQQLQVAALGSECLQRGGIRSVRRVHAGTRHFQNATQQKTTTTKVPPDF
jgi:hypothetical protein